MSAAIALRPKTILVVDDDEAFRAIVCDVLEGAGYRTLRAQNALQALHVNQTFPGRIDLVLIDVVMPLMSGITLADRIRKKRPVRLLLMSGQVGAIADAVARMPRSVRVIPKPVTHGELLYGVRDLLGNAV